MKGNLKLTTILRLSGNRAPAAGSQWTGKSDNICGQETLDVAFCDDFIGFRDEGN